jgi:hypothetical protein
VSEARAQKKNISDELIIIMLLYVHEVMFNMWQRATSTFKSLLPIPVLLRSAACFTVSMSFAARKLRVQRPRGGFNDFNDI